MNELNSVQTPLIEALNTIGWTHVRGDELCRTIEQPFVEPEVIAALQRLNPQIAANPARVDEILPALRMLTLAVSNDGLVETNRDFAQWLRGFHDHEYVGTNGHVPVRLIDFESLANNHFVVSDEVTFGSPAKKARFDIVLWVNGFPLVVGELKTPVNQKISWMKGAKEISEHYEVQYPQFFVSNAFSFASEGKEFMYGSVGAPVHHWQTWGPSATSPTLARVLKAAQDLLKPQTVLAMVADYTLFERPENDDGTSSLIKIVARYPQYEAVSLICDRAHDTSSRRGLIYHTQGSGKTLAMVLAAAKMLRDPALANPTIILIADRVQLVRQMWDQFRTTAMPRLLTPASAGSLRDLLSTKDQRGLIFTTVHKFAGAEVLNTRENIVVLVDEAHRTQEADLGQSMRAALPNARFFGFTGTPLADLDRNTFDTFGDPTDPGKTLHKYDSDQSIADGMTVPIHVAPRVVEFQLDKEALDEAFEEMKAAAGLTEEEGEVLSRRASRVATFFANPERVARVCADIAQHFYSTVDPLGMKAQVVVADRALCIACHKELSRLLEQRYEQGHDLDTAAVVMTVSASKDEDANWEEYGLTDTQEEALLKRFRTYADPLKFLIVTAKLGTGFNAPIEGVMYLDKPLKLHTLYQTIARTNRTWRNPETKQDKRYGLVVDYVGLGDGFARAMAPTNPNQKQRDIDVEGLIDAFEAELKQALLRFTGIKYDSVGPQTLQDAHQRLPEATNKDDFAAQFLPLEAIWEACAPADRLLAHKPAYRFLSQVYASITPSSGADELLWHRLGAKTLGLVHDAMSDVRVTGTPEQVVIADAETIKTLVEEGLVPDATEVEHRTASEIIDSIAARLKKRLDGDNGRHPVYKSLAERLDKLRERTLTAAQQSIDYLRELFTLAKEVTAAENVEDESGGAGLDLLPDPNVGALTQIFNEYAPKDTPVIVGRVVEDIDAIVKEVRYDGWAATQQGDRLVRRAVRSTLKKYRIPATGELFDRAYEYIAEHY